MGVPPVLPFLVYHDILSCPRSVYDIEVNEFVQHLDLIERAGWITSSLRSFLAWQRGDGTLPHQSLVLTFDDGYAGHGETVFPLLVGRGMAATFFVSAGFVGKEGYLTWDRLIEMAAKGMEIGSHGLSHRPLSLMGDDDLRRELRLSRDILEERLGRSVDLLSIPRGYYSRRVREFALRAGYRAVCTSRVVFNHRLSDPRDLGRVWVRGRRDIEAVLEGRRSRFVFQRLMQVGREFAKTAMGYSLYNRLRRGLLGKKAGKM